MLYYKSKFDKRVITPKRTIVSPAFVANELYTEKELRRYCARLECDFDKIVVWNFEKVCISKQKIYWLFGCRFADFDEI